MRRAQAISAACAILAGCSSWSSGELAIHEIDPPRGPAGAEIAILGTGFHLPITTSLDHGTTEVGTLGATIGATPLDDVVRSDEQRIEATVPATLPDGDYPITVTIGDRSATFDGYVVDSSGGSGTPDAGADAPAATPDAFVAGSLVVTRQEVTGPIDISAEGTSDWAVWGATAENEFDHKATGGGQIANWTVIGGGTVYGYGNAYNQPGNDGFTWSGGTPVATQTTAQYCGVWIDSQPNGFSTTVPAGRTPHTFRMYVGAADATGTFTAHLSDGSAPDYVDVSGIGAATRGWAGVYQIVYNSSTDGAQLVVSWVQNSGASGDVNWSAASLQ